MPKKIKENKKIDEIYEKYKDYHLFLIPEEHRLKIRCKRLVLFKQSDEITNDTPEQDMNDFMKFGPNFKVLREDPFLKILNEVVIIS